jgi:hypothetical protein
VLAQAADHSLERKIGVFQDVVSVNDEMNEAQLNELAATTLQENNKATVNLTVNALGQTDIITGVGVFAIVRPLGVSKTYYVEEDVHTFKGRYHGMNLKLCQANDVG